MNNEQPTMNDYAKQTQFIPTEGGSNPILSAIADSFVASAKKDGEDGFKSRTYAALRSVAQSYGLLTEDKFRRNDKSVKSVFICGFITI